MILQKKMNTVFQFNLSFSGLLMSDKQKQPRSLAALAENFRKLDEICTLYEGL